MIRLLSFLALATGLALASAAGAAVAQNETQASEGGAPPAGAESGGEATDLAEDLQMIPGQVAVLQALDKISARISTVRVPVGQSVSWERLDISVAKCARSSPFDRPEKAALMRVAERRRGLAPVQVFSGWMFASSPALHAMEHPVYDVLVIDCLSDAAAADPAAGTEEAPAEPAE